MASAPALDLTTSLRGESPAMVTLVWRGGRGDGTEPSKLAALQAAGGSIGLSPITKISTRPSFAKAYLGSRRSTKATVMADCFCFSISGRWWHCNSLYYYNSLEKKLTSVGAGGICN